MNVPDTGGGVRHAHWRFSQMVVKLTVTVTPIPERRPLAEQYGSYAPPPSYGYPPPAPPTNGLAVASLVLSLLGLVGILPLIGTVLGLIFGYSARNQIAQSRGLQGGEGLAQAGIIIGWVTLGIWALGICAALIFGVVVPGGLAGCALCAGLEPLMQGY